MSNGLFLCTEGGDGSGKGTQHELMAAAIEQQGRNLLKVDFPQYAEESSATVIRYLNNEFGDATQVDPYLASLPFAIDRFAAKNRIESALSAGQVVLANRFTASNMAHQGAKFETRAERVDFFKWLHTTEHSILGIPEPSQHFVLHVPADIARQRVLQKSQRGYTTLKLDGHEADLGYQKRAEQTYLDLAETFPEKFTVIECVDGEYQKTPAEVHGEIWSRVKELL